MAPQTTTRSRKHFGHSLRHGIEAASHHFHVNHQFQIRSEMAINIGSVERNPPRAQIVELTESILDCSEARFRSSRI